MLALLAVAVRWPNLWDVPRYTDELQEVLWALSIAQGQIRPLTAVDSYYGPVWSYLLAGLFWIFRPSPDLPRLVALLIGAAMVVLTYYFARDLAGRWPAWIAAGLLLTSGGHIIINSHTARSNSTTPLLTTAAVWLIWRALAERRWQAETAMTAARRPDPRLLAPAGFLLGLALQTHLSVVALLPGLVIYALWQGWRYLRSPWPYLGALAMLVGYGNMIVYNLANDFWSLRHARGLQAGYTGGRATDIDYYLANLGNLLQSLARLLSGTIDAPDSLSRFVYAGLTVAGMALLTRRSGPLLLLSALSIILVLPYFNPRYGPILSGRYLIPLLPIGFTAIACLLVAASRAALTDRTARAWRSVAALIGIALVVYPLVPLTRYYRDAFDDGRTNQPLHELLEVVERSRLPTEKVLLDEGLEQEPLGAGGTDLKAFRMLLSTSMIPYDVGKVSEIDGPAFGEEPTALAVMETKKRASLPRSLRATVLSREISSASGSEHRYAVYRLAAR